MGWLFFACWFTSFIGGRKEKLAGGEAGRDEEGTDLIGEEGKISMSMRGAWSPGGTVEHWLGDVKNPTPPEGAQRVRVVCQDREGVRCETAKWIIRALCKLEASVWVEHARAGSLRITDRGRGTLGYRTIWACFYPGEVLTFSATGPEASRALDACREFLAVTPEERKQLYRERYAALPPAGKKSTKKRKKRRRR